MYKKIGISVILTAVVLAFPVRLFTENVFLSGLGTCVKAVLFIIGILILGKPDKITPKIVFQLPVFTKLKYAAPLLLLIVYLYAFNIKKWHILSDIPAGTLIVTFLGVLLAAFSEELVFRYYIPRQLENGGISVKRNRLISSLLFAGIHLINIFRMDDFYSLVNQVAFAFLLGIILCSLYMQVQSIVLTGFLHGLINLPNAINKFYAAAQPEIAATDEGSDWFSVFLFFILMSPILIAALYYANKTKRISKYFE